jgi:hypothetical protein
MKRITLTPEWATRLLEAPHEKQRKINPGWVADISRKLRAGEWPFTYDPILLSKYDGKMFNGGHRCTAVVQTGIPMDILIEEKADPDIFGKIDAGLSRRAYQFVHKTQASTRVAGCRIMYWYDHAFERPMDNRVKVDLEELLTLAQAYDGILDRLVPLAGKIHKVTTIPPSISLGALLIAVREGYGTEAIDFAERVSNPVTLDALDPAWRLVEKMMTAKIARGHRRRNIEDWTVFVRALNASILDTPLPKKFYSSRIAWPLVGESEADFNRRTNAMSMRRRKKEAEERRVA